MKSLIEYIDYSCLDGYKSAIDIKTNSCIRIENNIVELFTNGKLIAKKDIFSIIDNPRRVVFGIGDDNFIFNENCFICDFLFKNNTIRSEINNILYRNYRHNIQEEYNYFEGWEYNVGRNFFLIKDNIISCQRQDLQSDNVINLSDNLSKILFIFDEEHITTHILPEYKSDTISTVHDYILYTGSNTKYNLFKYYYRQKKILNRNKIIDEIIG